MKKASLLFLFAAALTLSGAVGCNSHPTPDEQKAQLDAIGKAVRDNTPTPQPAPTAEQIAAATKDAIAAGATKDEVQEVVDAALLKQCKPHHPRRQSTTNPQQPAASNPQQQAATQPALQATAALKEAAQATPIELHVDFPESIRMESAFTDKPPCPAPAKDDSAKKSKEKPKPCPGSLAERQTAALEGINTKVGKLVKPLRIIAGASVVTAVGTAALGAEGGYSLANPIKPVTNVASSFSCIGECAANGTAAGTAFKGAGGTVFKIAVATHAKQQ